MAKFLFTRTPLASETPAGSEFQAGYVYELTGDVVERWDRRNAGHAVPNDTPLGVYKSPEQRAAEAKARKAEAKPEGGKVETKSESKPEAKSEGAKDQPVSGAQSGTAAAQPEKLV